MPESLLDVLRRLSSSCASAVVAELPTVNAWYSAQVVEILATSSKTFVLDVLACRKLALRVSASHFRWSSLRHLGVFRLLVFFGLLALLPTCKLQYVYVYYNNGSVGARDLVIPCCLLYI